MTLFAEIEGIDGVKVPMHGKLVVAMKRPSANSCSTSALRVANMLRPKGRGIVVASDLSNDLCLAIEPLKPAVYARLMKHTWNSK